MSNSATLKMDAAAEHSLLDDGVQGLIGQPLDRVDGPKKVAGKAPYSAEYAFDNLAYGVLVGAPFARGRITAIDDTAAMSLPGVLAIVSDPDKFLRNSGQGGQNEAPVQNAHEVFYMHQPVALAVAETFEQARAAAAAVVVRGEPIDGEYDFEARLDTADTPDDGVIPPATSQGDIDQAMVDAAVTVDGIWTTPGQNSAAMEPHVSTAIWDDDGLTLYGAYQMVASDRMQLADALGLDPEQVRIVSAYVGGGFGSKLGISSEAVASAIAAKQLGRPVKTVMTRQQVFDATIRRSNTRQRIRLGADENGVLHAIGHESLSSNLPDEDFFEPAGIATHFLYRGEHRRITHGIVRMNRMLSGSMRAPGEAVGLLALECAMDELAEKLGLDPVELRKRNIPDIDPEKQIPYSARKQVECLEEGAKRFGWDRRNRTPGAMREGEWLIGHGVAAAARTNQLMQSEAVARLTPEGRLVVETDMTDIGTGTYTVLMQIAGEMLGLPADRVDVHLGDSRFPPAAGSGGSWGAGSSGSSVYLACRKLREQLAEKLDCDPAKLTLKDGEAIADNRRVAITDLIGDGLEAHGRIEPGKTSESHTQSGYGAHFCEVRVNAVTGEVRVARWTAVYAAGRILNEKTARSQCYGGIIFGIGAALTEALVHDPRDGRIVNHDLAEYHVPVHADIPQLDVVLLPERDPYANPLQAKGIGELGIAGAGAAVANAVYNATGVRVRDYPLTLDKLLSGLPPV